MKSFVIADPEKCIGCGACEIACAVTNSHMIIPEAARIRAAFNPRLNLIFMPEITMPIQCRQCEDAPCAQVCPVGGIVFKGGVVHVKQENCIGCKMCMAACPVGAVNILPRGSVKGEDKEILPEFYADKCELCNDRKEGPACLEVCPAEAFTLVSEDKIKETIKARREKAIHSMG
ncbi:4Fe-4S dicluster domain-containing protein [Maridesulfovibrio hydrothermalis]|uniref:Formate dehydrogenase-H, [4Fe-4S] ferredoxin subunit n=1 Tax=Maridesulfovibrio hydrothermalis AM13 = DSM 14728 TaxID=1121451 RepID=L0RDB2_9BACT|nr:4Fe-4S dicluster domain-containing protein [Maridesulfovibrio hydrothermalis]CCO24763.1 formate dehydrogenase-H [4Fe-4S] ferredoxin subunit [Maridesulfovibrio hydrothermalis AM13 = DSM 14728]